MECFLQFAFRSWYKPRFENCVKFSLEPIFYFLFSKINRAYYSALFSFKHTISTWTKTCGDFLSYYTLKFWQLGNCSILYNYFTRNSVYKGDFESTRSQSISFDLSRVTWCDCLFEQQRSCFVQHLQVDKQFMGLLQKFLCRITREDPEMRWNLQWII